MNGNQISMRFFPQHIQIDQEWDMLQEYTLH